MARPKKMTQEQLAREIQPFINLIEESKNFWNSIDRKKEEFEPIDFSLISSQKGKEELGFEIQDQKDELTRQIGILSGYLESLLYAKAIIKNELKPAFSNKTNSIEAHELKYINDNLNMIEDLYEVFSTRIKTKELRLKSLESFSFYLGRLPQW